MFPKKIIPVILCFLSSLVSLGQITNKEVVAKIKTEKILDLITVTSNVESKTQVIKSLKYVMYVYKKNPDNSNVSKNEQSGRIVLNPNENKELSKTTINQNSKDKVTVLLLVYDSEDKLVAKDRLVVLNDDESGEKVIKVENVASEDEFVGFRGIVIEETKTKPGRDFYIEFYSNYRLKGINGSKIVKITEQFSFGRNTIMEIFVDNEIVYRFFVQPTKDFIKKQSDQAIVAVTRKLIALEKQKNQIRQY
ncbi:CsgE family curli-type amyloid fiber assembly protein [Winogradskyella ursingii]|uniref:CsgE family curli-type amyloid fiber assembly protein n=1 Tax=Winogradskyella ursingii TaxID=2686079 RepID=UPI0015CB64F6|nr:CsgE family curli-type amyloid fiber assembly protein [Winogradskyella ursingii]